MIDDYNTNINLFGSSIKHDPIHDLFVKRKQKIDSGEIDLSVVSYNKNDLEELEEFCKKYGIVGLNFGNINPRSTLKMLKSKMGVIESPMQTQKSLLKG